MCFKIQLILAHCLLWAVVHGLEFLPNNPRLETPDGPLIWYNSSNEITSLYYRSEIDNFMATYTTPQLNSFVEICEFGIPPEEDSKKVCDVSAEIAGPCTAGTGYGYNSTKRGPCIFLTPTKVTDWVPEYYNSSTVPEDMPDFLKSQIRVIEQLHGADSKQLNTVWVSCGGENPADVEYLGAHKFYPHFGFGGQHFPIRNDDHYLSPFVAVHFENPKRGLFIHIECKAWARNLINEIVRFQIVVD